MWGVETPPTSVSDVGVVRGPYGLEDAFRGEKLSGGDGMSPEDGGGVGGRPVDGGRVRELVN